MGTGSTKKRVFVWERSLRIFHWVNALSITILLITGFYISSPFFGARIPEEAYYSFVMGWARYIHFFFGFVFIASLIFRFYLFLVGNQYAKSNPLKASFWTGVLETGKHYLFMKNNKKHYVGHNPLAELSYWIFMGLGGLIVIATGLFLLFEPQPGTLLGSSVAWMTNIFGNSANIRGLHFFSAVAILVFVMTHHYFVLRETWLERNKTLSSMFTGYKEMDDPGGSDDEPKRKAN
ncbi:Ni/Fe-hydrogenase, b-type cytochrome subunit [Salisediminibacterium beveridgei]|uniref:Ni,Fe-hydrogenase I cytochrome b subunit n=1 Tax=Salisediminibacterium beveridgei TaxID=632773 RepID=A0A1D7QXE2_9BACI|nr:Ni/Fe-hydrogenase, b-type cytochrome subunit [Salisediminibacterium beveridgei]AOM83677.1 Ni,Fe-hydrogenase I cytochrome b subunit [Salisediminibacterium beveridgei]